MGPSETLEHQMQGFDLRCWVAQKQDRGIDCFD